MPVRANMLAIDPGTDKSGWIMLTADGQIHDFGVSSNEEVLEAINHWQGYIAIEMIASYGMPVGREVFETCVWIGRFIQAQYSQLWKELPQLIYRKDVKMFLCGTTKAKDANVRQALIDLYPATGGGKVPQIGTKSQPGPLYGITSHTWPALGVAITARNNGENDDLR